MKISKEDAKFIINYEITTRNFLTNVALYQQSFIISISALLISVFSLIYALNGLSLYTIIIGIVFLVIGGKYWFVGYRESRKNLKNARTINQQLDNLLLEKYPIYKKRFH